MKCPWHLCQNELPTFANGKSKRYCSPRCKNKYLISRRRRTIKLKSIAYLGGKCSRCSYDRCPAALEFHHRDDTTKVFGIASKGNTRKWSEIVEELDKCVLLCANCHRELHYETELVKRGEAA